MGRRMIRVDLPSRTITPSQNFGEGLRVGLVDKITNLEADRGTVSHVAVVDSPIWNAQTPVLETDLDQFTSTQKDKEWIVTVFDNDFNTELEVMAILMVATKCDANEAAIETWEVHHLGKSVVHHDSQENCLEAAKTIATIGIRAEATPDPLI